MKLTQTQSSSKVGIVCETAAERVGLQDARAALKQFGVDSEFVPFRAEKFRSSPWKIMIVGSFKLATRLAKSGDVPVVFVPQARGRGPSEALIRKALGRPDGAGIACVAINGGFNAGLLAAQMIGIAGNPRILNRIRRYKQELRRMVLRKKI